MGKTREYLWFMSLTPTGESVEKALIDEIVRLWTCYDPSGPVCPSSEESFDMITMLTMSVGYRVTSLYLYYIYPLLPPPPFPFLN
jgi:hypothetical protein